MLPPGMLERLELVAELAPGSSAGAAGAASSLTPVDLDLLDQLAGGPRPARSLAAPEGRAGLTRRLRALAAADLISLEWTLLGASAGPRYERWIRATDAGREAAARWPRAIGRPGGRSGPGRWPRWPR